MYYLYLRYMEKHFASNPLISISYNISWYLHTMCQEMLGYRSSRQEL
jgi:hypothetical protein